MRQRVLNLLLLIVALSGGGLLVALAGDAPLMLQTFATRFLGIFIEAAPFLLLGTLVSGLIEAFVSRELIARLMPRSAFLATVLGGLLGFAFPVCECGVVPVARRLMHKGLPVSVAVSFLLAAPIMNPIVLASTFAALGWGPVLIGRFVIGGLVAIGIGLIFTFARPQDILRDPALAGAPLVGGQLAPISGGWASRWCSTPTPGSTLHFGAAAPGRGPRRGRILRDGPLPSDRHATGGRHANPGQPGRVANPGPWPAGLGPDHAGAGLRAERVLHRGRLPGAGLRRDVHHQLLEILAFLTFGPMVDIRSTLMFLAGKRRVVVYLIPAAPADDAPGRRLVRPERAALIGGAPMTQLDPQHPQDDTLQQWLKTAILLGLGLYFILQPRSAAT